MPQHFSFLGYKQQKLTAGLLETPPPPRPGRVQLVKIDKQTLLKLTHKHYTNLIKISQKGFTNVSKPVPQTLLKITKN